MGPISLTGLFESKREIFRASIVFLKIYLLSVMHCMFTTRGMLSATRDSFFLADDRYVSVAQAYGKNRRFPCSRKVYLRRKGLTVECLAGPDM
jgi:hypothetical protein